MDISAEQIQSLLDVGNSVTQVASILNVHHEVIRRIVDKHNLEIYVAFDEQLPQPPITWNISDDFRVVKSGGGVGYDIKEDAIRDAVSEFVMAFDPDEITSKLLKEYRHIESYVYLLHVSLADFYAFYNLDGDFIAYSQESKRGLYTRLGHEFQRLVTELYDEIPLSRHPTRGYGESIPDYISGKTWIDAKLSKSTALNVGCETITKYRKHTDHLVIIYAIDDTTATDARAKFVHVSEYYPYISAELQRKIDAFVRKASAIKFGGAA